MDALFLKGCIVAIDAMGCQKRIIEEIIEKGADYVLSLKGNQGILHDDVRFFLESEKKNNFKNTPHSYFETVEKGHGRVEARRCWITDQISWLDVKNDWKI